MDNSAVRRAVVKFNKELVTNKWDGGSGGCHPDGVQQFLAIMSGKEVISFIAFQRYGRKGDIAVIAAWTDPKHRRTGLYHSLFNALVKRLIDDGQSCTISGAFHEENEISRNAQVKQGRKVDLFPDQYNFYRTTFNVNVKSK